MITERQQLHDHQVAGGDLRPLTHLESLNRGRAHLTELPAAELCTGPARAAALHGALCHACFLALDVQGCHAARIRGPGTHGSSGQPVTRSSRVAA